MRDILLTLMVFGSVPFILRQAWIGVLVWSWLSYMNPHRLTYGFAYNMPFAQVIAGTLLLALFVAGDKKSMPRSGILFAWGLYIAWMCITTLNAIFPEDASLLLTKIIKIQVISFITIVLITSREKLNALIWVIVLSIGYFSFKGGVFTLITGGQFRVWGPPGSYIEENNSLALATLMIIPLMYYLFLQYKNKWVRYGLLAAIMFSLLSALGSQSRGAFLAMLAVAGYFWIGSKHKAAIGGVIVIVGVLGIGFMPESWHERMDTLQNYEEDASAMGRINAWQYAINIASDRFTGGGLHSWKPSTFALYAPIPEHVHAAHSIYFGPLGDHGWIGLLLFLTILFMCWRSLGKLAANSDEDWVKQLSTMIKVSFIAYFSGGAFLSLAYFDLPWHMVAITIILVSITSKKATDKSVRVEKESGFSTGNVGRNSRGGQSNG